MKRKMSRVPGMDIEMKFFKKLFGQHLKDFEGGGLIIFDTTHDALKAEKILAGAGLGIKLVAPPISRRQGCDLALEFGLIEKLAVERVIRELGIENLGIMELDINSPRPVDIVDITRYEGFTMVRAGNMKLTLNNASGIIVNISGGGCPDVPYLYRELVGKEINEAPLPRDLGYTLCALMLDRAFKECGQMAGVS